MVAKNPVVKEKGTAPWPPSRVATDQVDLQPSDIDSQIVDLIEVIEDEISSTIEGAPNAHEPPTANMRERDLCETLELEKAFPAEREEPDVASNPAAAPIEKAGATGPRPDVPRQAKTPELTQALTDQHGKGTDARGAVASDQPLAEFSAARDPDLSPRGREQDPSADENGTEPPPTVEEDLYGELLEDLESTERAVAQETEAAQPAPSAKDTNRHPALLDLDWVRSEKYYPRLIASLDRKIVECQQELGKRIKELTVQRDQLKQSFADVRSLLIAQEEELRKSIIRVFTTFWKLKVSELDADRKESFQEDLLVEHNGRKVIFKIKSTATNAPSLKLITQLWQDLHYSGLGASTEAGLILNQDARVDPKDRGLAYGGDKEEYLEDIIFVDTCVLYNLTLAIIDDILPVQQATELLLRRGRVRFQLDDVAT
jgi:hypothetical protein